ncbi:MAG: type II secretion system F family protein [Abitibacteriaceae bacterium]|nr:type II secretion system F family protein [Abditibacteriaceae bacterium]MBV9864149.1 type II secretion system F family protein [Abditibacteriaceae bacterium]
MALGRKVATADGGMSVDATQAAIARGKRERFEFLARFLKGRKGASKIQKNLVTAGLMLKPTEFLMVNLFVAVITICLGMLWINGWGSDFSLIGIAKKLGAFALIVYLGWKGPQMVLQFMANKRRTTLEYQLTDALTIISSGLKGGYSFIQGLSMAAEQLDPPIKDEFARVIRLVQLGLETSRALETMSERVNSYDYDMTVSATNIQLAVGGNLSQLLEGIAATIRDRIRLRRDIAALTAQGRISGGILIAMPLGIAVMLKFINPDYMDYLFKYQLGNNLLIGAGIQQAMGIYWIKKLLDFDN